jgi:hypothetical protein
MADDDKGGKPNDTDPTDDKGGKPDDDKKPVEDVAGLKSALAKEREARRKAESEARVNAEAAKRLKDAEDADKSEVQKAADRATAAEKRAEAAEARILRLEIAAEKGLSVAQAKRLVGDSRDELEADADELLEAFGAKSDKVGDGKKPDARTTPKEKLRPGASTSNEDEEQEVDAKQAGEMAERISKSGW